MIASVYKLCINRQAKIQALYKSTITLRYCTSEDYVRIMPLGSLEQPSQTTLATRKGIAWGLDGPTEDSSVLVTGTPSKWYIDIRFSLQGSSTEGPFWAFSGQAKYAPLHSDESASEGLSSGWGQAMRGEWAHPIDSMGNLDGVDRADIFTLVNGDQVEFGTLEHPDTGKLTLFKEYWTKPEKTESAEEYARAVFEEDGQIKGMMIRVGRWMQGIIQISKTEVKVGRWQKDEEWQADKLSPHETEETFPREWLSQTRKVGDATTHTGRHWTVVESSS